MNPELFELFAAFQKRFFNDALVSAISYPFLFFL